MKHRRTTGLLLGVLAAATVAALAAGALAGREATAPTPGLPVGETGSESAPVQPAPPSAQPAPTASQPAAASASTPSAPEPPAINPIVSEEWNLILVSAALPLPEGFAVELADTRTGYQVDKRIVEPFTAMLDAAAAQGITLMPCSSYRTQERSAYLYERQIQSWMASGLPREQAAVEAAKWVAPPGTSEHHTGLAIDIVTPSYQGLDHGFADTAAAKWMAKNAHTFGFVVRFPEDKQDITGITYEPWHMRYVGVEAAAVMFERGICLEEYLTELGSQS